MFKTGSTKFTLNIILWSKSTVTVALHLKILSMDTLFRLYNGVLKINV